MPLERNGVGDWGSAMVTTQKNYSPTNPGPAAMTVAQIDQALRDFVLQDTTHLRRDAETATQGGAARTPRRATDGFGPRSADGGCLSEQAGRDDRGSQSGARFPAHRRRKNKARNL